MSLDPGDLRRGLRFRPILTFALLVPLGGMAGCNVDNQDQWFVVIVQPDVGSDLAVGDTVTLSAKAAAYDLVTSPSTSSTSEPARFHWASANPAVATVDDRGRVRAVATGETQIEATFAGEHGGRTRTSTLGVVVPAASLSLVVQHDTVTAGDTVRATVVAQDEQGHPVQGVLIQVYSDPQLALIGGSTTPVPGFGGSVWGAPATAVWRTTVPGTFVVGAERPYLRQSQTLRAEHRLVVLAKP